MDLLSVIVVPKPREACTWVIASFKINALLEFIEFSYALRSCGKPRHALVSVWSSCGTYGGKIPGYRVGYVRKVDNDDIQNATMSLLGLVR